MLKRISEEEYLTFDDVLIKPCFSTVDSRQEVDLSTQIGSLLLTLPVISSNMDTVTGTDMCAAMSAAGGIGVLHRFWSAEDNAKALISGAAVSAGLGEKELQRAIILSAHGAKTLFLDVAHGATASVIKQVDLLKAHTDFKIIVGNFAGSESLKAFLDLSKNTIDGIKVGIGPGSACTTRIKTGIGVPQLSAILECVSVADGIPIIADGGIKTSGDIAKALAAGAAAVMLGGMLSGTDETPGSLRSGYGLPSSNMTIGSPYYKIYRGSASAESYEDQGKDAKWRTAEGESFLIPHKGPVSNILKDISGGLRSAFSYVGARTLSEFQKKSVFIRVSASSRLENGAHGKKS